MSDDFFYDKSITLMKTSIGHKDYNGVWIKGQLEPFKSIFCDVQPASREQIYKDYGYYIDCTKRIFSDIDTDIKTGGVVKYQEKNFTITNIVEWNDYLDIFLKEGV